MVLREKLNLLKKLQNLAMPATKYIFKALLLEEETASNFFDLACCL